MSLSRLISGDKKAIIPIANLHKYLPSWRICGICYHNETFKEAAKNTRVLSFYLADEKGSSVKISAFGNLAQNLQKTIRKGNVYYVVGYENCLKNKNMKYNRSSVDFEIELNEKCDIERCFERDVKMPDLNIVRKFIKFISSESAEVDVLGIIHEVGELETVMRFDEHILKREFTIVDQSRSSIAFVTWCENAEQPIAQKGDVIAIKYGKVNAFSGSLSLSQFGYSQYFINPEQGAVEQLKKWYKEFGYNMEFHSLTLSFKPLTYENEGRSLSAGVFIANKSVKDIVRFNSKIEIIEIDDMFTMYRGCEHCQRKLSVFGTRYVCDQCEKIQPGIFYYILKIVISDGTNAMDVMVYDEAAAKLIGLKACRLFEIRGNDENEYRSHLHAVLFQSRIVRIRSSYDNKNNKLRFILTNMKTVHPVEYEEEIDKVLEKLELL